MCSLSFLLRRLFLLELYILSLFRSLSFSLPCMSCLSHSHSRKKMDAIQSIILIFSTQANEKCFSTISEAVSSMWNISNSKIRREYNHLERTKRRRSKKKNYTIQKNGSHSCLCAVSMNIIFTYEERGKIRCRRTNRKKNSASKRKKKKKYIYDVK